MKTRKLIPIFIVIVALLLAVIFVSSASGVGNKMQRIYLPLVLQSHDPNAPPPPTGTLPTSIDLTLSVTTVNAGDPVSLTATVKDQNGYPYYDESFDVSVLVNGRSAHGDNLPLTSLGDGTYTGTITYTTGSGQITVTTHVYDKQSLGVWIQSDSESFEILPLAVSALEFNQLSMYEVQIIARDAYSNPVPVN